MRKLLFDGQWINAEEIERVEMSWGDYLRLYKDEGGRFYATICDGMPDVIELCRLERSLGGVSEEMARKAFQDYIQSVENEQ